MSAPSIRPAAPADAPAVAAVWHLGWQDGHIGLVPEAIVRVRTEESFRERAAERVADTTVAEVDGVVAGFVMVVEDEVEQVYVSRDHRGSGVAALLMDEAERQVRASGHAKAWLAVVEGNGRARAFYERVGWTDEGQFDYAAAGPDGPIVFPCRRYTKSL
jgi:GNAT superfamily N-acetyltransferase